MIMLSFFSQSTDRIQAPFLNKCEKQINITK